MSTGTSESPVANPASTAQRVRVIIFGVVAALAGLFFLVPVVLMASAPWVLLQPDRKASSASTSGLSSAAAARASR
jgi:hypothetical protein